MAKYIKKILEYSANTVFNKLLLLLLIPLFTRWLPPEEYAIYTNLLVFISFAGLIYMVGQQQTVFSYFYNKKGDEYKFTYISSIFISIISLGIVLSVIVILFHQELSWLILRTDKYSNLFILVSLVLFFDVILGLSMSILNIMEKSTSYLKVGIIKNALFFLLILACALLHNFSIEKLFLYLAISSCVSALFASYSIIRTLRALSHTIEKKCYFSFDLTRNLLVFGVIMIPGTLALISLRLSDRLMLTYFSPNSLYDVGIYAVGYRIGMIITIINSLVSLVWFPYAMKKDTQTAPEVFKKIFYNYVLYGGLAGIAILMVTPEIFSLFIDKNYYAAMPLVIFGVASNFLYGVYNIINLNLYKKQKATYISAAVGIGAIVNLILNYLLIPKFGVYGAGYASILAYLLIVVINYVYSRKFFTVTYRIELVLFVVLSLIGISYIMCLIPVSWLSGIIKLIVLIVVSYVIVKKLVKNPNRLFKYRFIER